MLSLASLPSRAPQKPSSSWSSLRSFGHQWSESLSAGTEDGGTDVDGVCAGYSALSGKGKKNHNLFIAAID